MFHEKFGAHFGIRTDLIIFFEIEPLEVLRKIRNALNEKSIRVTEHNVLKVKDTYICKNFRMETQRLLEENPDFNRNWVEETA